MRAEGGHDGLDEALRAVLFWRFSREILRFLTAIPSLPAREYRLRDEDVIINSVMPTEGRTKQEAHMMAVRNRVNKVRYGLAFLSLVRDPERTDKIFDMVDAAMKFPESAGRKVVLDHALAQPGFQELHERMYLPKDADLDELIQLPEGTLGHAYAAHMKKYGLSVDFYRAVQPTDALRYFLLRLRQTHDVWQRAHGVFSTTGDELALQAFVVAQTKSGFRVRYWQGDC